MMSSTQLWVHLSEYQFDYSIENAGLPTFFMNAGIIVVR